MKRDFSRIERRVPFFVTARSYYSVHDMQEVFETCHQRGRRVNAQLAVRTGPLRPAGVQSTRAAKLVAVHTLLRRSIV